MGLGIQTGPFLRLGAAFAYYFPPTRRSLDNEKHVLDDVLKGLHLKKIIRENHGKAIGELVFNRVQTCNRNLLASVSAPQINVYDNENCGEHLDIVLNYVNSDSPLLQATETAWKDFISSSSAAPAALDGTTNTKRTPKQRISSYFVASSNGDAVARRRPAQQPAATESSAPEGNRLLRACTWLRAPSAPQISPLPNADLDSYEDTWIAAGGADGFVQITSIAQCKVIHLLAGCHGAIEVLTADPTSSWLAAISSDGHQIVIWHIPSLSATTQATMQDLIPKECLPVQVIRLDAPVRSISFVQPKGLRYCLVAGRAGQVLVWLPNLRTPYSQRDSGANVRDYSVLDEPSGDSEEEPFVPQQLIIASPHGKHEIVHLIQVVPTERAVANGDQEHTTIASKGEITMASRAADGKIMTWTFHFPESSDQTTELPAPKVLAEVRIPQSLPSHILRFDITPDGRYVAAGNSKGQVYIFDLVTAERINLLEHKRLTHPIPNVLFSYPLCTNLIFTCDCYIWRYVVESAFYFLEPPSDCLSNSMGR
jgi:WD40 repeat protein